MYSLSLIGNDGKGATARQQADAQFNRKNNLFASELGNYNFRGNIDRKGAFNDMFALDTQRLQTLHKDSNFERKVQYETPMYRPQPWKNFLEFRQAENPMSRVKLLATDERRQMDKRMIHGYRANLVPEGRLTNYQDYQDNLMHGVAGEVNYNYNQTMFDKQRDDPGQSFQGPTNEGQMRVKQGTAQVAPTQITLNQQNLSPDEVVGQASRATQGAGLSTGTPGMTPEEWKVFQSSAKAYPTMTLPPSFRKIMLGDNRPWHAPPPSTTQQQSSPPIESGPTPEQKTRVAMGRLGMAPSSRYWNPSAYPKNK